jgi:hypothetical protein
VVPEHTLVVDPISAYPYGGVLVAVFLMAIGTGFRGPILEPNLDTAGFEGRFNPSLTYRKRYWN